MIKKKLTKVNRIAERRVKEKRRDYKTNKSLNSEKKGWASEVDNDSSITQGQYSDSIIEKLPRS